MATITTDLICNLNQPVEATFLHGNLFSQDNAGNTINVHVMDNGEPATIGGTVSANVIRADGNTVAVSGAIEGNKASVVLPQACYAVPGRVEIIIKLTQSTTITTIAAIVANVYRSTTDTVVDPGTIIPSIQTLIEEIEEAVDSIPVDYSGLLATIAADYSSSKTYPVVGMYAWQGGVLKRNIVPITTAETYTAAHWTDAVLGDDLTNLKSALFNFIDEDVISDHVDWTEPNDSTYPNGWLKGYYNESTGESVTSNVYIKTLATHFFQNENATILHVVAPSGYYIAAYEYTSTETFVKRIGDPNPANSTKTTELFFPFEKGHKFRFSLGRFASQSDAESHYGDSAFVSSITADFYTVKADEAFSELNTYIKNGNNLLTLNNFAKTSRSGVDISIENGVMTLNGTASANIRMKLSGDYELATTAPDSWKTETVTQFEIGKTYSIHNQIISGNLPSSVGVSLRNSSGSSVVSVSIPEATLSAAVSYAMLYIPNGTYINVSFVPMFIEGHTTDEAYNKELNRTIHVDGVKLYEKPDMAADFIYDSTKESAIKLPANYKTTGKKTPLIILAHGLSSTISASTWGGTDMQTLVDNFVGQGFAVIDVNQVTTQDWCNPALIDKYVAAIQSATEKYNVVPSVVYGESMGSLIGLCLAKLYGTVKVCAVGGIRLDFAARYAELSASNKAIVDANLGFTNGFDAYKAAGWDKTAFASVDANNNKICPVQFPPTLFVVGSTDTLTKTESLAKIDEIKRGGTICKTSEYTGDHNAVCYLKPEGAFAEVVSWFNKWL